MKAAVVRSFDRPLEIEDLPIPEPCVEQALVRIEACGLCHTDIHAARGEWPGAADPAVHPRARGRRHRRAPRHGQQPRESTVGRPGRAAVAGIRLWRLPYCIRLGDALRAAAQQRLWRGRAFAEYGSDTAFVARLPAGQPQRGTDHLRRRHDLQGREGVRCDLRQPRRRVRRRRPRASGDPVRPRRPARPSSRSIPTRSAWSSARELGAEHPRLRRRGRTRRRHPGASAVPTRPSPQPSTRAAFEQAMGSLRARRYAGLRGPSRRQRHATSPIFETVLGGLTIRGSIVGTHRDLEETFELHRRGLTRVLLSECRAGRCQRRNRAGARRQRSRAAAGLRSGAGGCRTGRRRRGGCRCMTPSVAPTASRSTCAPRATRPGRSRSSGTWKSEAPPLRGERSGRPEDRQGSTPRASGPALSHDDLVAVVVALWAPTGARVPHGGGGTARFFVPTGSSLPTSTSWNG